MTTNTNSTRLTYNYALTYVLENMTAMPDEIREKLEALREQQEKRNGTNRKPTAQQEANKEIQNRVCELLVGKPDGLTISEMLPLLAMEGLTGQRLTAVVTQLVPERLTREVVKRRAYFRLNG